MSFYSVNEIRLLHLELSSDCNAECPLCVRNLFGYPLNRGYEVHSMTLAEVEQMFAPEFVGQLTEILVNGNFGDIVMNPEALAIIKYFRRWGSAALKIGICTNGGARDQAFWQGLAQLDCEVSFCLDGLEDTHSIYRRNTLYSTVLNNAQRFIAAGGRARWKFVVFDHNRHQIDQARELSQELGFDNFILTDHGRDTGPVFNSKKELVYVLGRYQGSRDLDHLMSRPDEPFSGDYSRFGVPAGSIRCQVKQPVSVYVNSIGEAYPCCYIGHNPKTFAQDLVRASGLYHSHEQLRPLIKDNSILAHGLARAIKWFDLVEESWTKESYNSGQLLRCNTVCGQR